MDTPDLAEPWAGLYKAAAEAVEKSGYPTVISLAVPYER